MLAGGPAATPASSKSIGLLSNIALEYEVTLAALYSLDM